MMSEPIDPLREMIKHLGYGPKTLVGQAVEEFAAAAQPQLAAAYRAAQAWRALPESTLGWARKWAPDALVEALDALAAVVPAETEGETT